MYSKLINCMENTLNYLMVSESTMRGFAMSRRLLYLNHCIIDPVSLMKTTVTHLPAPPGTPPSSLY